MRVVSRKLPLPTVENCRDLGGIHTEQGRMVRPGLLVRSANLHDARHDDLETLAHRGISNVIDLFMANNHVFVKACTKNATALL